MKIYVLSRHISFLRFAQVGIPVLLEGGALATKGGRLSLLQTMIDLAQILRAHGLASQTVGLLEDLISRFRSEYNLASNTLDYAGKEELSQVAERIEASAREAIESREFSEPDRDAGILDYNQLITSGAKALFGDGIYYKLPKIVQRDLEDAAKSLSFGAPTAGVMVGLRAVEGMLRELYLRLTGEQTTKMWAKLLEDIQRTMESRNIEPSELFGYLQYVRTVRNEADHPDRVFSVTEAEQLLHQSAYVLSEIQKIISQVTQKR